LKTDAGQLPYLSVSGGAVRTAVHKKVDLHCYARRHSGGESRSGSSILELEPSSKSVTRGSRDQLSLKIVSPVCSRREEEKLEAEEDEEAIHLDPVNAYKYVLVVQAFSSGKLEPVSAELVLGPFEVFNHPTSAVRCTPHATRHTPHATRHTPHATRHTPHATRRASHAACRASHATRRTCATLPELRCPLTPPPLHIHCML